VQCNSR